MADENHSGAAVDLTPLQRAQNEQAQKAMYEFVPRHAVFQDP